MSDDFISLLLGDSLSGIFFSEEELVGGVVTSDCDEVDVGGVIDEEVVAEVDDEEEGAEEEVEEEEEEGDDMNIDITDSRLEGTGEGVGGA